MSKEYAIEVFGHPSISAPCDRYITVLFNEPEDGINKDTGVLLFIAGYGGQADANVYKKMRTQFSDQYNLVTVQCDYFGHEFMQEPDKDIQIPIECLQQHFSEEQIQALFQHYEENESMLYHKTFSFPVTLAETIENYNDMGPVQAMDQLIALKVVSDILEQNNYTYNKKKVIAYGQSHGAYLAHLCNCYMPQVFSAIIDNSSYLYPYYINHTRDFELTAPHFTIIKQISYLASRIDNDMGLYDLNTLYQTIDNTAQIIAFQGRDDNMTAPQDKQQWLATIPHTHYEYVDSSRVDDHIFHSTLHGMDADFLQLFAYVWENYSLETKEDRLSFEERVLQTNRFSYHIRTEDGIPIMYKTEALA